MHSIASIDNQFSFTISFAIIIAIITINSTTAITSAAITITSATLAPLYGSIHATRG